MLYLAGTFEVICILKIYSRTYSFQTYEAEFWGWERREKKENVINLLESKKNGEWEANNKRSKVKCMYKL